MAITPADEWMCHQTVKTFDQAETSDSQFTERVWFAAFEKTGKFQFAFGMGKYINRNVMDASVALVVDGKTQHNVRASRALFPDIETYKIGPLGYDVVEPLVSVRVTVEEHQQCGFTCDLRFIGETEIYQQTPAMYRQRRGRVVNHMIRYFQTGSVEGWIELDGQRHEVRREDWWASRDRSWGLRSNTGEYTAPDGTTRTLLGGFEKAGEGIPFRWNYFTMQFGNWNTSFEFAQTPENKKLGPALGHLQHAPHTGKPDQKIIDVDLEWDFVPGTKRVQSIQAVMHLDDGTKRELTMKAFSVLYRRPGGGTYGGWKDWTQGVWMGQLIVEGEAMSLEGESIHDELHFTDDFAMVISCDGEEGWGLSEPLIPGIGELFVT